MKNLRSGLYILVLACFVCMFILPCMALAQDGDPPDCCHTPPGIAVSASSVAQPDIQLFQSADNNLAINTALSLTPVSDLLSVAALAITENSKNMSVIREESWTPGYRR